MDLALIGFGLGVGILVGMTGIGGGSLMTPMLILVFGVTPITAIGTDLAYAAVTKTVGGYKHWRQKTVDLQLSTWMALGSVPAAVCGVYVLHAARGLPAGRDFDDLLLTLLAGALLLTGVATLVRAFLKRMHERERDDDRDGAPPQDRRRRARRVRRLRARRDLGGQRRADRRRPDPAASGSSRRAWSAPTSSTPRSCSGRPGSPTSPPATSTSGSPATS